MRDYPLQNGRVFLLAVVVGSVSCSSPTLPLAPAPPSVPTPAASPRPSILPQISVGEVVSGSLVYHGARNTYEFTAPRDGTLTVSKSYDSFY